MRGIIVYHTKYGSTRQYAEWVREETGFDLCEAKRCPRDLRGYDTVVLGSSVFAGRLTLASWIRAHWPALQGKTLLLFFTHLNEDPEAVAKVAPHSLPAELVEHITVFPVGGRYILSRMSWFHRTMIKMVASKMQDPKEKAAMLTDSDRVNRDDLQPLFEYLRHTR